MAIPNKNFAQLVSDMVLQFTNALNLQATAIQTGDAVYAVIEGFASQLVFLEAQAQLVNAVARAATSSGADLDSFFAQFGFARLPATFMTGQVTFGKLSASQSQILIPVGTIVQTTGGAVQYQVVADPTQPTWSSAQNAYVMAPGQTSLTATVQALVAGTAPNVIAGQLNQIGSSLPGIDTVNNGAAINNGLNAESDPAARIRFVQYLAGLAKATSPAILSAINGVQQGLFVNLLANTTPSGSPQLGEFTAVIDDGSGSPPATLISNCFAAANAVRGFCITAQVVACTKVVPPIALAIRLAAGALLTTVGPQVATAVAAAVNAVALGSSALYVSTAENAALGVPGVTAVKPSNTTINGAQSDFALTSFQVPRIAAGNVTVTSY